MNQGQEPPLPRTTRFDWRTISALNATSLLAQVGQFGVAYVALPVWLADQGLNAAQLGFFAASLWTGQLVGLATAPWLARHIRSVWIVLGGLLFSIAGVLGIPGTSWPLWLVSGWSIGFGLGLRWIGLEPWLYGIAPSHARGRLVGFHESLIGAAPIVGPLLVGWAGVRGNSVFVIAIAFTAAAALPLALTRSSHKPPPMAGLAGAATPAPVARDAIFKMGVVIALLGGMLDAAWTGLFPLFAGGRGFDAQATAELLVVFGLGGLLMQYPVGWLADHRGLAFTTLACALGTAAAALSLSLAMPYAALCAAVFLLGGFITALLTLALIAGTTAQSGSLSSNVSAISILYTGSGVVGPPLAGLLMNQWGHEFLLGFITGSGLLLALVVSVRAARMGRV